MSRLVTRIGLAVNNTGLLTGGVAPPTPYLGNVATRVQIPDYNNTTAGNSLRARKALYTNSGFTNAKFRIPNFFVSGFSNASPTYTEIMKSGITQATAVLEYPAGTYTRVTFSGVNTGVLTGLPYLDSDVIPVTVPPNSWFYSRLWWTNPTSILINLGISGSGYGAPGNFALGDVLDAGNNLTDNTGGGAYTATSGTSAFGPMAVLAMTTLPSMIIFGDSLAYGAYDLVDSSGNVGSVARSLGSTLNYMNYGIGGDSVTKFLASHTNRIAMLQYASHVILQGGINDFVVQSRTAAQLATDTDSLVTLMAGKKNWLCTLPVSATTTDNYATLGSQTTAAWNASRVTENQRRRALAAGYISGYQGFFDIGGVGGGIESSQDSGFISPGHGYLNSAVSTLHPVQAGYLEIAASGAINPALFTYP